MAMQQQLLLAVLLLPTPMRTQQLPTAMQLQLRLAALSALVPCSVPPLRVPLQP